MNDPAIDAVYAFAQLGLAPNATLGDIQAVLDNVQTYRFATRKRIDQVRRFVEFFYVRDKFGGIAIPYADIRKAYHKKALELHPDRTRGDRQSEDELKAINADYALIEDIHREAKDYYRLSDEYRREAEADARKTTEREREAKPRAKPASEQPQAAQTHARARKFMAASVPRFVRNARLSHIPVNQVIGSWYIEVKNDINQVFDVIMLPELEFTRMRLHLSVPKMADSSLERGGYAPPYVLKDIKELVVPEGTPNPGQFARDYFIKLFKLAPR